MGFSPCGRKEPDKTEPLTYSHRGELEGASLRAARRTSPSPAPILHDDPWGS